MKCLLDLKKLLPQITCKIRLKMIIILLIFLQVLLTTYLILSKNLKYFNKTCYDRTTIGPDGEERAVFSLKKLFIIKMIISALKVKDKNLN